MQTVTVTDLSTSLALKECHHRVEKPQFCWVGYRPQGTHQRDWTAEELEDIERDPVSLLHNGYSVCLRDESTKPPWLFINLSAWAYTAAKLALLEPALVEGLTITMITMPPSNWEANYQAETESEQT